MRAYLELARGEFRRYSSYRLAVLAGVFTNSVFGFIRLSVLLAAIVAAGGSLADYSAREMSTYVWLGQALLAPIGLMMWTEIADRVKNGEIAVELSRPVDLQLGWWVRDLGRAAFEFPTRGLPPLLVGVLTVGIAMPASWTAVPLGLLSVIIGISISFAMRFLLNLIAFWTVDVRGFVGLYFVLIGPLCGLFVPIHMFPEPLRTLINALPFPWMFQAPIDVLSGRVLGGAALYVIGIQTLWLAALLVVGRLVLGRAARRLVVQGG